MDSICTRLQNFPFAPEHGEDRAALSRASFFSGVLNSNPCFVERVPLAGFSGDDAKLVTWFRALQTLPAHENVLPRLEKLIACPSAQDPAVTEYFLVSPGVSAAAQPPAGLTEMLVPLHAYLSDKRSPLLKQSASHTSAVLSETTVRGIVMDALCGLQHLSMHGLSHGGAFTVSLFVNPLTGVAKVGSLSTCHDMPSGTCPYPKEAVALRSPPRKLGHLALALASGNPLTEEIEEAEAVKALDETLRRVTGEGGYSDAFAAFVRDCFGLPEDANSLTQLLQSPFLRSLVAIDVNRARTSVVPAVWANLVGSPNGSFPRPTVSTPADFSFTRGESATSISAPLVAAGLPHAAESMDFSGPRSPYRRTSHGITTGKADPHVLVFGRELPKRDQYYVVEGGSRHWLGGYGIIFELAVSRSIHLEDIFFTSVGDVKSMHAQLWYRRGRVFKHEGGDAAAGEVAGNKEANWTPVLRRPKHLRKVMAHRPLCVGPFDLSLAAAAPAGGDGHSHYSFLLCTNYAYGVRFYGMPQGLLGQAVGAPMDRDDTVTVTTGVPCGPEVCAAAAGTLRPQTTPDLAGADDSGDDDDGEVEDPRLAHTDPEPAPVHEGTHEVSAAALSCAVREDLSRPVDYPRALCGGLKYVIG